MTKRMFTCRIAGCGEVFASGFQVGSHIRLNHPDYEANKAEIADKRWAYREANKAEIADKKRAYREANKAEIADKQRAYYEANKAEIADKKRAYREANKAEIADKKRAYREANKAEIADKKRAYYEANKAEIADKKRAYREANKAEIADKQRALHEEGAGWDLDDIVAATDKPYWLVREWSSGGARDFPRPVVAGLWRPDEIRSWCERRELACKGAA